MIKNSTQTTVFGDYSLLKELSHGSNANIFLAFKNNLQGFKKFYIIKKIFEHIATDTNKLQGFIREGEIATSLSHQNIVYGHEYGTVQDEKNTSYYLAMDYIFGKNLAQIKRKEQNPTLPVEVVVNIVKSVANGLHHAHNFCDPLTLKEQNITHRDISPDNIIVSYNGETRLTDFGISQRGDTDTRSDKIAGKLSYMSPEQIVNKKLDNRTDIYSLGVVFWEFLTGEKLIIDHKTPESHVKIANPKTTHPCEKNSSIPQSIGDICMRCLEFSPENRFQSAKALSDALSECSDVAQIGTSDVRAYLQQIFAEEFAAESGALLRIQETSSIDATQPGTFADTTNSSMTVRDKTDDVTNCVTKETNNILLPNPFSLKEEESDNEQTKTGIVLHALALTTNQCSTETTLTCESTRSPVEQTTEFKSPNLLVLPDHSDQTTKPKSAPLLLIGTEDSLKVFADPRDTTQTDYEVTLTKQVRNINLLR